MVNWGEDTYRRSRKQKKNGGEKRELGRDTVPASKGEGNGKRMVERKEGQKVIEKAPHKTVLPYYFGQCVAVLATIKRIWGGGKRGGWGLVGKGGA